MLKPLIGPRTFDNTVNAFARGREWVPCSTRHAAGNGSDINIGANFVGATFRTYEKICGGDMTALRLVYANIYGAETAGANTITVKSAVQISRGTSYTASAGAATTITFTSVSFPTNELSGKVIFLTGGTGAGQYRFITSNTNAASTVVTVPTWGTNPDNTSTFEIFDCYHVLFNGQRSRALDSGEWIVSDDIGAFAASGVKMFVHTYVSVTAGGHIPGNRRMMYDGAANASTIMLPWSECTNIMDNDITLANGTGGADQVDSGNIQSNATYKGIPRDIGAGQNWITAMTNSNDGAPMVFGPTAVLGKTLSRTKPSICVTTDSRYKPTPIINQTSASITLSGAVIENGCPFAQAMAQSGHPHLIMGVSGETLWQQVGTTWNLRSVLAGYTDYELICPGINDMVSNSVTAAYILNYLDVRCKAARAAGRRPILVTYLPKATSSRTDNGGLNVFVLASDQTTDAANTVIQSVNASIRAGTASTSAWGYWDAAAVVEDGGASAPTGKWADAPEFTFLDATTTSTVGTVLLATQRFTDANLPDQTSFGTWGAAFQNNSPCQGFVYVKFVTSANSLTVLYYRLNVLANGQTKALTFTNVSAANITAGDTYKLYLPYTQYSSGSDNGIHLTPYGKYKLATSFAPTAYALF